MPLQPVQFINENDIFELLAKLKKLKHITLVQDRHGNQKVQTEINYLAQQLLVANDGNTYLFYELIHASEEEKQKSSLTFITRNRTQLKLGDLEEEQGELLIHNYILAQMLASMVFKPENKLYIRLTLPVACPTNLFTILFPVITPWEISYDRYDIENWLQYCLSKNKPFTYPIAPNNQYKTSLVPTDLITNIAAEQLIWLYLHLSQKRMQYSIQNNSGLKQLNKLYNDYELSLLHKKFTLDALFSPQFQLKNKQYKSALAQYPQYKNSERSSLFKRKIAIKNTLAQIEPGFELSSILTPLFGFFSLAFWVGSNETRPHELDLITFFNSSQNWVHLLTILAFLISLLFFKIMKASYRELIAINTLYDYKRLGNQRIYGFDEYQKRNEKITSLLEEVTALKPKDASKINQEGEQSSNPVHSSFSSLRFFHPSKLSSPAEVSGREHQQQTLTHNHLEYLKPQ